ncbi:hypothetical protein SVAN01_03850 [Stagonosporopsis vannaccii]|nr:hypothetical protein SVAN01_03850 [Stagonosporopsis vannaccii]
MYRNETGEVYVKGVSLHMLVYFCGEGAITSRLYKKLIFVRSTCASKDGIVRAIRYMRRWCLNASIRPTGNLRTPPTTKEGMYTSLACCFFNLDADAQHMEILVVNDFMCSPRIFIADEDVELIWCGYEGILRETSFGDTVIWFVLEHVMGARVADEIRWMMVQEDYGALKARIRVELKRAAWRGMGRRVLWKRCTLHRERRKAAGELESSKTDQQIDPFSGQDNLAEDKPLPHRHTKFQRQRGSA